LIDGNQSIGGVKTFTQGTTSTSTSTGTIVVSGNGGIGVGGNAHVGGTVKANALDVGFVTDFETVTLATTSATAIASFPIATFSGAKIVIQATRGTERQCSEVLVTHNDTTATFVEYGIISTGNVVYNANVDVSGGNVRVLVTGTTSGSTKYNALKQMFKI
jgi:hypothetical protein